MTNGDDIWFWDPLIIQTVLLPDFLLKRIWKDYYF
jgi:hypothetical protein